MSDVEQNDAEIETNEAEVSACKRAVLIPRQRVRFDGVRMFSWMTLAEAAQELDAQDLGEAEWDKYSHKAALDVGASLLSMEAHLSQLKWFEYRYLHPAQATVNFARSYRKLFSELYGKYYGIGESDAKMGIARADIFAGPATTLTSLWHARQFVDARGLPYDFYIRRYMELWKERGAKQLPRPNQLWNEEIGLKIEKAWRQEWEHSLPRATAPQFWNANFKGDPAQVAHHDWLVQQIKRRLVKERVLGQVVFADGLLSEARAETEFGESMLREARRLALPPEPRCQPERLTYWPGCFGVPHAHLGREEPCGSCPWSERCALKEHQLRFDMKAVIGSEDIALNRKRASDRARQRRRRAGLAAKGST